MSAPSLTTGVGNETAASVGVELPIANLACPTCAQSLESALRAVSGVMRTTVNLATKRAFVEYDPKRTGLAAVHEAMKAAGYRVGTRDRPSRESVRSRVWYIMYKRSVRSASIPRPKNDESASSKSA